MALLRGEIGAGKKRGVVIGSQEHGQGPAAASLGQELMGILVNLVQVWPFLPVNLDVDEQPVHDFGGFRVLKRFVRHDMAPVAGGIADAEQDGLVLFLCFLQGLVTPWIPIHGVVGVLE